MLTQSDGWRTTCDHVRKTAPDAAARPVTIAPHLFGQACHARVCDSFQRAQWLSALSVFLSL